MIHLIVDSLTNIKTFKNENPRTSLVAQWLRLRALNEGDLGLIPGQRTRSHMHAATKEPKSRN